MKLAVATGVGSPCSALLHATTDAAASGTATSDESGKAVAEFLTEAEHNFLKHHWASTKRTGRAQRAQNLMEEEMIQSVTVVSTEIRGVRGPRPDHVVGTYNKGKLVFPPSTAGVGLRKVDALVLMVLEDLADYLQSQWLEIVKTFGKDMLKEGEVKFLGARLISGNRYEFFIKTDGKKSACFLNLIKAAHEWKWDNAPDETDDIPVTTPSHCWFSADLLNDIEASCVSEEILNYVIRQAKTIRALSTGYNMGNFAYIVSVGPVTKQDIHIDLGNEKHHQLAVLCSKDCSMTSEYVAAEGTSLQPGENLSAVWLDMPPKLALKLSGIENVQPLLDNFGNLLCTSGELLQANSAGDVDMPIGSLLCLPGAVPHCGPAVTGTANCVRAILFFTATPTGDLEYDPETQYSRSSLISDIMRLSWTQMKQHEREYMLDRWYHVGLVHDSYTYVNLRHAPLREMAATLSKKNTANARKKYIKAMANKKEWNNAAVWHADENYDDE